MAENKKGFVLYCDLIHTVKKMPKEKIGELFLTILFYVNDENPVVDDLMVDLVFEPIKLQLKRDLQKYEVTKEKRSAIGREGGIKSGEKRRLISEAKQTFGSEFKQNEANEAIGSFCLNNEANEAVTDKETDKDIVTDKEIVSVITPHAQKNKNNSFKNFPISTDVDELPELKINAVIELLKITKNFSVNQKQIVGMWAVFKTQNLTGKKHYPAVDDVYSHFINWIKLQTFVGNEDEAKTQRGKESNLSAIVRQINESERLKNQANGK